MPSRNCLATIAIYWRSRVSGGFTENPHLAEMNLLQFHETSELLPLMRIDEFEALKRDIATHGQREPICLYEVRFSMDATGIAPALISRSSRDFVNG